MTPRILIAEDNHDVRELVCELISIHLGNEAVLDQFENGANAVKAIENSEQPYGLVITDLRMPGASGIEVLLAAFKAGITNAILTTGTPPDSDSPEQDLLRSLIGQGMNLRLLVKPTSPSSIYTVLDEVFENE